ncbi:MAG: CDP-glycerol glycerophosphotransferase family protein [Chlamydiales bacterium]|nr:CDP-glycerol glycerophosphotransferase family protein [Chlamydiales bacterium]
MRYAIFAFTYVDIDHIAPMAYILGIPLIVCDEKTKSICETCYPQVKIDYVDQSFFTFENIWKNYDVIIHSYKPWANHMRVFIDTTYRKQILLVYCPHGNSDKTFTYTHADSLAHHDHQFIYGDQMRAHIKKYSCYKEAHTLQVTGNYRKKFYEKFKEHFDALAQKTIFSQFEKKQTTLLYAPTWQDPNANTSFMQQFKGILQACPKNLNLLIKLHPNLEQHQPAETHYLLQNSDRYPNIVANYDFTPTLPLISGCDAYLGDYSSVGYDFLATCKPMFFLTNDNYPSPIHKCGLKIPKKDEPNPFSFIQEHLNADFSKEQQDLYKHAFDDSISFDTIRKEFFGYTENTWKQQELSTQHQPTT